MSEGETEILERHAEAQADGIIRAVLKNWQAIALAIGVPCYAAYNHHEAHAAVWSEAGSNLEKKTEAISDLQNRVEMLESNVNQLKGIK